MGCCLYWAARRRELQHSCPAAMQRVCGLLDCTQCKVKCKQARSAAEQNARELGRARARETLEFFSSRLRALRVLRKTTPTRHSAHKQIPKNSDALFFSPRIGACLKSSPRQEGPRARTLKLNALCRSLHGPRGCPCRRVAAARPAHPRQKQAGCPRLPQKPRAPQNTPPTRRRLCKPATPVPSWTSSP